MTESVLTDQQLYSCQSDAT